MAPFLVTLDRAFGIVAGSMTTIHRSTRGQPTVGMARGGSDLARRRAAALSMVPTTTSAGKPVDRALPHPAGRVPCRSVRAPVASVSADHAVLPERAAGIGEIDARLAAAGGVIAVGTGLPVPSYLRGRPENFIHTAAERRTARGGLVRGFGRDDGRGLANRVIEPDVRLAGRSAAFRPLAGRAPRSCAARRRS